MIKIITYTINKLFSVLDQQKEREREREIEREEEE
jgi:hypothetical protein